ncbi:PREDICTED: sec1 family domain-containing protein MIP3 isoform X1 [Theobroma cacao]|uniref:Sec1 family domain-containing protein MIP3 isoform X1 n=2 Tax=Theobroma cacao TaxID=3641 RepID=A0AB32VUS4_THECC|nr:PREDICTED: sec1 family domain-containing protein MIP3 isoform X1 [Theobroma cacao]XP_017969706.1 PREDICTED: sec1 family domain-containing protein MIP3 isoform X1 [Theobroma cacao]
MALIDVNKSCLDSISQISQHIEGAIIYLDAGCTESFQLMGAFPFLLDLGVRSVCSLENMCSLDAAVDWNASFDPARKIVIMASRLLSDAHRYVLRCLSTHRGVHCCSIFTSISEVAHSVYPDSPLGPDAYHEYETLLLQDYEELVKKCETKSGQPVDSNTQENLTFEDEGWSQFTSTEEEFPSHEASPTGKNIYKDNPRGKRVDLGRRLIVSVHHFPMILCPFSPRVFVLPSEGSVAEACLSAEHEDSLSAGLPSLSTGLPSDGDEVPPAATLTAHFLYHLAAKMDLKMEIFSLGDLSKTVGKILTDMSSLYDVGRRKRTVGLLLIDRTLDLLTPCCHGDSLVDRMFSSLPRKERTSSSASIKGSQAQLKLGPSSLERAPLEVQIPIGKIITEEDSNIDDSRLSDCIEAFLCGWDSYNSASQMVDLINFSEKTSNEKLCPAELLKGSLVSTENFRGTPYLEAILDRTTKDGAILVKKWLQETLRQENITINVRTRPGFASKSELQPMIKALAKSQSSLIRNRGIIQLATAALYALDESCSARWDAFISAEKILSVNAGDTSQSLVAQIGDLINKSAFAGSDGKKSGKMELSQGLLSFQDALLLTITGYILAGENFPTSGSGGPFSWQEEHFLKEAIVDAILENPSVARLKFLHGITQELEANLNKTKADKTKETSTDQLDIDDFDDDQWGKWGDEDEDNDSKEQAYDDMQLKLELRDRVDNLFKHLHKLSSLKSKNVPLREGPLAFESNLSSNPYTNKGLLYKLLTKILGKYDVPGLEYHSSTVGRLFKSGFGRFGLGQAKPSLADQNAILVFVVGGINGVEAREAQEALSESGRPDIELILGGTTLLTPDDMLDLLLGQSSYI